MFAEIRRMMCDKERILTDIKNKVPKKNHRAEEYNPSQTILKKYQMAHFQNHYTRPAYPNTKGRKGHYKKNYKAIFLRNTDAKIPNTISAN